MTNVQFPRFDVNDTDFGAVFHFSNVGPPHSMGSGCGTAGRLVFTVSQVVCWPISFRISYLVMSKVVQCEGPCIELGACSAVHLP